MTTATTERHASITLDLVENLFGGVEPRDFAVRLWDGTVWGPGPGQAARFTLLLRHPGALRAMFLPPSELTLGEAYLHDDFDVEGDLESAMRVSAHLESVVADRGTAAHVMLRLLRLPSAGREAGREALAGARHSRDRDRQAIARHYDVSNEFYRLWLDPQLVYSCAYFERDDVPLAEAQRAKLDYLCRKLRLRPGERLLDIGCGWGALMRHASSAYGVEAVGITLSERQAELARERIDAEGLSGRCRVELTDYRDLPASARFDKVVSVGMFEHVGEARLPEYFSAAFGALKPGGAFLNHGIAAARPSDAPQRGSFSDRYVFPDGELVTIARALSAAQDAGFEPRDLENLREHYAMTLRHWVRRLEQHAEEAKQAADETTYRIWRLFMAASANAFSTGALQVYQTLLVKPDEGDSGMPLTRADWYR
jgi:cyclopropane-fatty-acyl-phospholipid synthase